MINKYTEIEIVENVICNYFVISPEILLKKTRIRKTIEARQIFHYLARKYTKFTLKEIANYKDANSDHSTVMHSTKVVGNMIETEKVYKERIDLLNTMIKDRIEIECFQTLADNSYKNKLIKEIINAKTINCIKIILQNRLN